MNLDRLEAQLIIEEGSPPRTYLDTKNILTGGIGHNLIAHPEPGFDRVGILVPPEIRTSWFREDIQKSIANLDHHAPWWKQQDDVRQNCLANLCFNMGWVGLSTFKNTLTAFAVKDYGKAAYGLEHSQWAKDVGEERSGRIIAMVSTGLWPDDVPALPDFGDVQGGVV